MDENRTNNSAMLRGLPTERPHFSHENRGESFYAFPLEVLRLSGAADTVNVIVRREIMESLEVNDAGKLCVSGELRSFNNKSGVGQKLIITVFARDMWFDDGDDENSIRLTGTICKPPTLRVTPMGREICDLMVAVNRRYGRSDYLPCIAWGMKAREASCWPVGAVVDISGRIQSRKYTKLLAGQPTEKTAFEVSVINITRVK
ncbi:MAG: single-stranded DNA-binding protein [Oscillospiraceae bacterium]|nr:single-stranded DNA-binding protein [Oscillospiraceae bacterium]MCD8375237.1 single-stranded DNA-binding protein [Oscillospiraceae bacterium]